MKLGFEAKRLFHNSTGLGNYARNLVQGLIDYEMNASDIVLYTTPLKKSHESLRDRFSKTQIVEAPYKSSMIANLWRRFGIQNRMKRDQIDLFHGLSHEIPSGVESKTKTVVTMHDLIYLKKPEYFPWLDRKVYDMKFRHACKVSDKVIAISEQTKHDLISLFGVREEKISVHYQSCHPLFFENVTEEHRKRVRDEYKLPERYLLYVGALSERKNVKLIVKALADLPSSIRIPLVIVGRGDKYKNELIELAKKLSVEDSLIFPPFISTEDLPVFYEQAEIFVYPSFYEGFGIPLIEAQFMGTPIISATGSCLEESGGPHSLYADPHDLDELSTHIRNLLQDQALREKQIELSLEFVKRFHLKETTKNLMKIYQSLF